MPKLYTICHYGLLVVGCCTAACWLPKETGMMMQEDIRLLKNNVVDLQKDVATVVAAEAEHNQQVLKKIEELSLALQEFNKTARLTDADFGNQLERMISDVQQLRGAVEVTEHRIGETKAEIEQNITNRITDLQKQAQEREQARATQRKMQDDNNKITLPKSKKEALVQAAKMLRNKNVDAARAMYLDIIKKWPKSAGTTDEAYFRLAESYFSNQQFDDALRYYIKVVDAFHASERLDDAYYKIGLCSLELKNLQDAQTFFTEIVSNHKKSTFYQAAKDKLNDVNKRLEQINADKTNSMKKR